MERKTIACALLQQLKKIIIKIAMNYKHIIFHTTKWSSGENKVKQYLATKKIK